MTKQNDKSEMQKLLDQDKTFDNFPQVGELIKGTVISASKKEVLLDINGTMTGLVRNRELYNESDEFNNLQPGEEVEATVMELENERGMLELSFRYAGHQKTWASLNEYKVSDDKVSVKITDANKGGLLITLNGVSGFLPVSQLSPEYYPRIQGGDKNKILEKLKSYVGQTFEVKVIDVDEDSEKLIVSEKAAWEETQKHILDQYKVGDVVEGKITAVTDFGVFVEFGENLEGLIHISELAWQRIDDPKELYKVGDDIKAEIVKIDGSKIFLSSKNLVEDPWKNIEERYKVDDTVEGKVLKATPFGLFVELDDDIHGLAHISELSEKNIDSTDSVAKPGDLMKFKIVSIEPKEHRLGLSIKAFSDKKTADKPTDTNEKDQSKKTDAEEPTEKEDTKETIEKE